MVDDDGSFIAPGRIAHAAGMTVPVEHFFAKPSKVIKAKITAKFRMAKAAKDAVVPPKA